VPEGLQSITIDFPTGELAQAGCSEQLATIVVPVDTEIPTHAACGEGIMNALRKLFGGKDP
jgi:hypothetical protein